MKKTLAFILALVMILGLAACGQAAPAPAANEAPAETTAEAPAETTAEAPAEKDSYTIGLAMISTSDEIFTRIIADCQKIADENGYNLTTHTEDGCHIITATIIKRKLFGIGYKTVVFKYHADSLLLKEIVLYDYSDNQDTYFISNVICDVPIDKGKFQF